MNKQIKLIISIIVLIIFIIVSILYFKNKNVINSTTIGRNYYLKGVIEDTKITKDEQYLYVKDNNGVTWKINISENTIFKQKLKLEKGDSINIRGKFLSSHDIDAIEISSLMLQQNK